MIGTNASGGADGVLVLYLGATLWQPKPSLLVVGYQAHDHRFSLLVTDNSVCFSSLPTVCHKRWSLVFHLVQSSVE